MSITKTGLAALAASSAIALTALPAPAATNHASAWWTNCTQLHMRYKHGLGKLRAHDHTRSGTNPVTTFYRSTRLYNLATSHNGRLDADHDGVACEQH